MYILYLVEIYYVNRYSIYHIISTCLLTDRISDRRWDESQAVAPCTCSTWQYCYYRCFLVMLLLLLFLLVVGHRTATPFQAVARCWLNVMLCWGWHWILLCCLTDCLTNSDRLGWVMSVVAVQATCFNHVLVAPSCTYNSPRPATYLQYTHTACDARDGRCTRDDARAHTIE